MEYKGYSMSDLQSLLLFDMLQAQKDILAELKRISADKTESQEEIFIGMTEDAKTEQGVKLEQDAKDEKKAVSEQAKKRPAKKRKPKTKPKTALKTSKA